MNQLQDAIIELQAAVDEASALAGPEAVVAANVQQAHEVIAYAHRLSFTTSAPQGFIPGQTPLMHFKPPAPQDIQLRSSALHQFQSKHLTFNYPFKYQIAIQIGSPIDALSYRKKTLQSFYIVWYEILINNIPSFI